MTAEDALDAQPAALENTVFEDGFDHVLAACGREAAGRRRQRRNEDAVKIHRQEEQFPDEDFYL